MADGKKKHHKKKKDHGAAPAVGTGGAGSGEDGVGERAVKNDVAFDMGEAAAGEICRRHLVR